jgi:heme/copper-type cytochrome/quinol oxidase subunit 3
MNMQSLEIQSARARHIPGEAGIWIFILGDMLVFAVFVFYRG